MYRGRGLYSKRYSLCAYLWKITVNHSLGSDCSDQEASSWEQVPQGSGLWEDCCSMETKEYEMNEGGSLQYVWNGGS